MFEPDPAFDAEGLLSRLVDLLAQARAAGLVVAFVQNNGGPNDPDVPHTPGWEIHPALVVQDGDIVVQKETPNAFHNTPLQMELDARGVQSLIVAGLQTEYCVDTTVRAASSLGYDVTLVADGHSTYPGVLPPAQVIAHHNAALRVFARVHPFANLDLTRGTSVPDLSLTEPFTLLDLGALQLAIREVRNGRIHYAHSIYTLNVLRQVWDPAFFPPSYRLSPAEWQVGMSTVFQDALRRQNPAWRKLVGEEVTAVAQQMLKSVLQAPDGNTRLISESGDLWCYQAPLFRFIYHYDNNTRHITLLTIADNVIAQGRSILAEYQKRYGRTNDA